ncbi:tricorn protease [Ornithinicoccus hortensis]|uniref:Tricorn protease homolog n=1 Tax=Ornithinicoccus hortensis TaxID=82346 RepID=A0A542YTS3_9MICO|nr:tricorn protease [Ornithinicoccus hortensis]
MVSSTTHYLRYPHIHQDQVTFVAADDIWLAPTTGGRAWRLTSDRAPVQQPRFSPDGAHIAFVSRRDGHPEVMVVDLADGSVRRLTWWGASVTLVLGWTADGRVLAASHAGEANFRHVTVRAVGLDGAVERLPYGPAWGVAVREDGPVALATPGSRPPAHWKRYRGGTAPRLWLDPTGTGEWTRLLPEERASLVDPLWIGQRLAFVSDRAAHFPDRADEQANLWVWDTPGEGAPRQLTLQDEDRGYVRDATTDGQRVVWHSRGRLWLLEDLSAEPREVEVRLTGSRPAPRSASPTDELTSIAPDHGGDASLVNWLGSTFWLTHREGPAHALVADSAVRSREPALLGRTGRAVLVTDAAGEDALEVHSLDGSAPPRTVTVGDLGRVLHTASDPSGERVATVSHDGRVSVVHLADGTVTQVGHSPEGEPLDPVFSPDGRYLAWSQPTSEGELHQLVVTDLSAANPQPVSLTAGTVHDRAPAFTRDGKFLVFLSDRTFDPVYDTHAFALAFTGSTRPWLLPLSATEPAPFGPSAAGWRISKDKEKEPLPGGQAPDGQAPDAETPPASPDLDVEGAEDRIVPFPVPSADYRDLRTATGGVLWVRVAGDSGALGTRRAGVGDDPAPDTLEFWSFEQRKVTTVADKIDSFAVSGDGERVVLRSGDTVTVQPADRKPDEDAGEVVTVDLGRLRLEVDPLAQWHQMYDENARIMRDHFWRDDMDGVDWDAVVQRWRPVVSGLATHDDFVDLLWEVVGELNTSHAYVMPNTPPGDQSRRLGLLGADLSPAEGGWRIDRILPGESTDPDARSPLRAAGVDAAEGDLVVAVNGSPVDPAFGPATGLVGAADTPVELTLRRDGRDRRVVVVPVGSEEILRYQEWVRSRREYVREHSGGRLGYVHVPDMTSVGWAQLHRDLRQATKAEGLIADVRYNRGGHTSQMVIAKLAAKVVSWGVGRHYASPTSYPDMGRRGPVVLVVNENSGSDGDIVNAVAQAMAIGPVVGVRTWGGVVGIDGRFDLVDGTSITQPRYATWIEGKGFDVENYGVDPDIEVVHTPADFFSARDKQLDRAIAEAIERLEREPAAVPPEMPEPKVRPH